MSKENIVEIVPGFHQIRVPVPIKGLGSVFVYLVQSGDCNLLVDTGWDDEQSYAALKSGLEALGLSTRDIQKIVISHLHPDHFGLSGRLKKESPNCTVMMHREDANSLRDTAKKFQDFLNDLHDWIRVQGAPESDVKLMMDATTPMMNFYAPAKPDIELTGGEIIRVGDAFQFQVISTPGHTIGNLCLYESGGSRLFFSGDHILPTITPNVSLTPLYDGGDPLADYLKSLEHLRPFRVSKVLPSHEYVFTDLSKRIGEIEEHHRERLEDTMKALSRTNETLTAYEVSSKLHWYTGAWEKLSPWEKRAALMETLAHLEYLKRRGKVAEIVEFDGDLRRKVLFSSIEKC